MRKITNLTNQAQELAVILNGKRDRIVLRGRDSIDLSDEQLTADIYIKSQRGKIKID